MLESFEAATYRIYNTSKHFHLLILFPNPNHHYRLEIDQCSFIMLNQYRGISCTATFGTFKQQDFLKSQLKALKELKQCEINGDHSFGPMLSLGLFSSLAPLLLYPGSHSTCLLVPAPIVVATGT